MSSLSVVDDDRVAKFVGAAVDRVIYPPFTAVGLQKDGEIVSGVVFNCFTGNDVHCSIAGRIWTRGFIADIGEYVFGRLKCERITAITQQDRVEKIAIRLGARREGVLRNYFGRGRDGIVLGILKDDFRF